VRKNRNTKIQKNQPDRSTEYIQNILTEATILEPIKSIDSEKQPDICRDLGDDEHFGVDADDKPIAKICEKKSPDKNAKTQADNSTEYRQNMLTEATILEPTKSIDSEKQPDTICMDLGDGEPLGVDWVDKSIERIDNPDQPMKKSHVQILHDPSDKLHKQQTVLLEKLNHGDIKKYITCYPEDKANNVLDVDKKIDLNTCSKTPNRDCFKSKYQSMLAKMDAKYQEQIKKPKEIEKVPPISKDNLYEAIFAKGCCLKEQYILIKQKKKELSTFECNLCKQKFSSRYEKDDHIMKIHIDRLQPKKIIRKTLKATKIITLNCTTEGGASGILDNVKNIKNQIDFQLVTQSDSDEDESAKCERERGTNSSKNSSFSNKEDQDKEEEEKVSHRSKSCSSVDSSVGRTESPDVTIAL